jgi:AmiR/NasT family two-component response regulator
VRVLIAEDDPVIALALERRLAGAGHEVVARVGDGAAAVAALERHTPDAVIMDVVMPGMDGLEAARRITAARPVPIVAITAHDDPGLLERAIASGVAAYLVKPVDARQVETALALAVTRTAEFQELREQVAELRDALEARKVIERAKGVLMDRVGLTEQQAFARIQKRARDTNTSMLAVARQVIEAAQLLGDG